MAGSIGSKGEATRKAIVDSATKSFARYGYHAVTTAQIAADAGVAEPTLFKHFGSKHGLLLAVLDGAFDFARERLSDIPITHDEPVTGLIGRAQELFEDPRFNDFMRIRTFAMTMTDDPEVVAALHRIRVHLRQVLGGLFRTAQVEGGIRTDVSAEEIADIAVGISFISAIDQVIDAGDDARLPSLIAALVKLLRPPPG